MFTDVVIVKNGQTFKPSDFWSKRNVDENGKFINPEIISRGSNKYFSFECQFCNHRFSSRITDISRPSRPQWCGYCAGKRLCLESEECEICFFKSFASCDGCKKPQDCSNWVKHNTTKGLTMWFQISYYCPACYEIIKYVVLEKFPN